MKPEPNSHRDRPRVHLLPPALANRIAAGEVVERPASVVKELCENALDADARVVEVDLEVGGVELCRVRDDGWGMSPEEAPLALERHATSKIQEAGDLDAIGTLGFRGEALPSIAAVSRFVLQTRARGDEVGTRVEVIGGGPSQVRAAGCPEGTLVEIRELFFNTPARRKFLKTTATETAHAVESVARLALCAPAVDFRVRVGGRESLVAPPASDLRARVAQVLRREVAEHLYPCDGSEAGVRIHGLVGDPGRARGRADGIYTYINGRFVRDKVVQHAIQAAYLPVLDRGRYPWVVLFVEIDPARLDVNVHPAKFEVRFSDGRAVHRAVEHVVAQAIQQAPWVGQARSYTLRSGGEAPPGEAPPGERPSALRLPWRPLPAREAATTPYARGAAPPRAEQDPVAVPPPPAALGRDPARSAPEASGWQPPGAAPGAGEPGFFSSLRVLGQVHRLYIVCEGPEELVLVDQHAAHERINFERLRAAFQQGRVTSQPLLFPATLELPPLEQEAAEAYGPELERLGFEVEPFGAGTVALKAAPALLRQGDAVRVVQDILGELARVGRASALEERIDALLATVACHASVRAGDPLGRDECEALLRDLDGVDFKGNCPHGRPVVLRAGLGDLERGFHRR